VSIWASDPGGARIPTTLPGSPPINVPLSVGDRSFSRYLRFHGKPSRITFVETLSDELVLGFGPRIESAPVFPNEPTPSSYA